jgi:hypothetical protein
MQFKETIPVYTKNHLRPINRTQSYWLLKEVVRNFPLGFRELNII